MKNTTALSLLIATLLFLYSCDRKMAKEQLANPGNIIDTFIYNGQTIRLDPIDMADLMKLPDGLSIDHSMLKDVLKEMIDDTNHVYRKDSILVLKFGNDDSVKLISSQDKNGVPTYDYLQEIKELNSYMTECSTDVNVMFSLWNKITGKETKVYSYPLASPGGKTVICFDRASHFSNYAFQVFSVERDGLHLRWYRNSDLNPHPVDFRWKDDSTLYMKVYYLDEGIDTAVKYVKMKLPQFSK